MRVLVVSHNYPRFPGDPAGAFVARLAAAAASRGHAVHVIVPHAPGLPPRDRDGPVAVERVRYAPDALERAAYRGDLHGTGARHPLVALGVPLLLAGMRRATRRAIRREGAEVIHAHWWIPGGLVAAGARVPLVITCHGSDVRLLERSAIIRRLATWVFRRAGGVTAVSRFLAEDLERLLPSLAGRVHVTPMPVEVRLFSRGARTHKSDPPRILYAGNLLRSKGVHILVEAFALLRAQGIRCRLRVLGEGPMRNELEARARALEIAADVEWSRFVPQSRMPEEYGASTVVVLPTIGQAEGLGLTLVEALLAGAAVVGTRAGGIPEVVEHERTGLLARGSDPVDLARQIERLLTDQPLRERLIRAGGEHARHTYDPDAAADRFLAIYEGLHRGAS